GGQDIARIGQIEPDADCAACRIEYLVDNRHGGGVFAADRLLGIDFGGYPGAKLAKLAEWQKRFDMQRVDLRDRHQMCLVEGIFPGSECALDHDTVDRANDSALFQPLVGARQFEPCKL